MTNNMTIFVTGGTGNQGGAVARNLSQQGFNVKVLTRNPDGPKAQKLKELNIQLVKGDLNHADTYREHLKDVQGIFSVQTFEKGVAKEIEQGLALASAAKEAGIRHFIYSSVAGADSSSGVPHLESKMRIESYIQQTGLPFTIIRPTSLYENFLIPQINKSIVKGRQVQPINRDTILQYVAAEDIGKVAVQVFSHPETYIGRTMTLATEQMSTQQVADTFLPYWTNLLNIKNCQRW
jgi:uncharacterized protein YbjT (DUF2867 family)